MECIQPVAPDLIAISHFTGRNLLDSFFQHRHHHFVIDQECLPGGENRRQTWNVKKIFLFFKCVFILCVCISKQWPWGDLWQSTVSTCWEWATTQSGHRWWHWPAQRFSLQLFPPPPSGRHLHFLDRCWRHEKNVTIYSNNTRTNAVLICSWNRNRTHLNRAWRVSLNLLPRSFSPLAVTQSWLRNCFANRAEEETKPSIIRFSRRWCKVQ